MTSLPRLAGRPAWLPATVRGLLLTALTLVGLLVFGPVTACAAGLPDGETRVGVSAPETIFPVGAFDGVSPGQGRGPPVLQGQLVVATGVAAKSDPLIDFAQANRTADSRFASEYTSPSGAKYYDTNLRGGRESPYDHHGGCAEIGCLLQAQKAEGAASGGSMRTVYNRPPGTPIPPGPPTGQGAPAAPCPACQRVLEERGIAW